MIEYNSALSNALPKHYSSTCKYTTAHEHGRNNNISPNFGIDKSKIGKTTTEVTHISDYEKQNSYAALYVIFMNCLDDRSKIVSF